MRRIGLAQPGVHRWRRPPVGPDWLDSLVEAASHALTLATQTDPDRMSHATPPMSLPPWRRLGDYAFATAVTALGFALAFIAQRYLSVANLSLIFLTAVIAVAVRTRMAVAVYTAMLCFFGYNFFFTPPRYTLAIAHADDVLAVVLFLVVALVCSRLATRLAAQLESLRMAQGRQRALLDLGQQLAASTDAAAMREAGTQAMALALGMRVAMLGREADGTLRTVASAPAGRVPLPDALDAAGWLMLPLGIEGQDLGVMAMEQELAAAALDPDRRGLAEAMVQDIGLALERARLAEELEQARVQGETERLRNALLSSVSHDLRSPLASMIGAAGTLASYEQQLPREERRQLMEAILEEGQRLDRYIQNLLDMTRLGHGTLKLNRDWVDAGEIVLAAVGRVRKFNPQLRVVTELPADTVLLYVHPALIEQALFNILENAAHFSPADEPVRASVAVRGEQLEICVSDRGPGIAEDERARIFDMFYSVSRGDRGHKGTGLGLSICRGMIGAHGGSVEALPGEAGGTTIRIILPLPPAPDTAP